MKKPWLIILLMYAWWLLPLCIMYVNMIIKDGIEYVQPYLVHLFCMLIAAFVSTILMVFIFPKVSKGISGIWKSYGVINIVYFLSYILPVFLCRGDGACPGGSPILISSFALIVNLIGISIFFGIMTLFEMNKKKSTEPNGGTDG